MCKSLNITGLVQDLDDCGSFPPVTHYAAYAALTDSALAGCKLCDIFQESISSETSATLGIDQGAIEMANALLLKEDLKSLGGFVVAYNQWGLHYRRSGENKTTHDDDEDPLDIWDNTYVRTRWCSMAGKTDNLPGRIILAEHNFELYKQWIWDCSTNHETCGTIQPCELPSRLLDIEVSDKGGEPGIKLVETTGMQGLYVALSHCWGKTGKPVTTSHNYHTYLEEIPVTTLPPTFRDAVTATRRLGFRYLWIDCFCIIQDSKEDWERECSQMARIFANAAVTIAGPEAANSNAGFLFSRPSPPLEPVDFPIKSSDEDKKDTVRIVAMSPEDIGGDTTGVGSEGEAPLRSRAWVLQERLLSTRNLYFGRRQTYFECRGVSWAEGSWTKCVVAPLPRGKTEFSSTRKFEENIDNWYSLAGYHYNECDLSVTHDKLPALSGLASKFHALHGSTYAAGLWLEDFPRCLAWKKTFQMKATQSWEEEPASVIFEDVPTWSWAHIKGLVVWWEYEDIVQSTLQLISHDVKSEGIDEFGAVTQGILTLRGRLKPAVIVVGHDSPWEGYGPLLNICNHHRLQETIARFFPDQSEPEAMMHYRQAKAIHCLQIGILQDDTSPESRDFWLALVLVPVHSEHNTYRRIGLAVRSRSPRGGEILAPKAGWFKKIDLNVIDLV